MRYATAQHRLGSYRTSLEQARIPIDEDLTMMAGWDTRTARDETHRLLALRDTPTAIFAASDDMAFGALHAARDRGLRVSEDLAVVGFDDIPLAKQLTPLLTTIRAPMD